MRMVTPARHAETAHSACFVRKRYGSLTARAPPAADALYTMTTLAHTSSRYDEQHPVRFELSRHCVYTQADLTRSAARSTDPLCRPRRPT